MAVSLVIEIPGGTQQQYDAVMKDLQLVGPNATWPEGILCHIAGPMTGGWRVVDVWESEEAFRKFEDEKLKAAAQRAGVPPFDLKVYPVYALHR
jgi:hypothetical protein